MAKNGRNPNETPVINFAVAHAELIPPNMDGLSRLELLVCFLTFCVEGLQPAKRSEEYAPSTPELLEQEHGNNPASTFLRKAPCAAMRPHCPHVSGVVATNRHVCPLASSKFVTCDVIAEAKPKKIDTCVWGDVVSVFLLFASCGPVNNKCPHRKDCTQFRVDNVKVHFCSF